MARKRETPIDQPTYEEPKNDDYIGWIIVIAPALLNTILLIWKVASKH